MSVEQSIHTSLLNNFDTIGPAVLVVSEPGFGAVTQVQNAVEQFAHDLNLDVKMSNPNTDSISYMEISANQLNDNHLSFVETPMAERFTSALEGRHAVVMIDATNASNGDVEAVAYLLNDRRFNDIDLADASFIVLARDLALAQHVDNLEILVNEPAPALNKQRLENQRADGENKGVLLITKIFDEDAIQAPGSDVVVTRPQDLLKKRAQMSHVDEAHLIDANGHKKTL